MFSRQVSVHMYAFERLGKVPDNFRSMWQHVAASFRHQTVPYVCSHYDPPPASSRVLVRKHRCFNKLS